MKKLLAVLLSLCLVVGMLPMMAFATDDLTTTKPTPPTETETTDTPQTNYEDSGQDGSGNQEGTGDKPDKGDDEGGGQDGRGGQPPEEPVTGEPKAYIQDSDKHYVNLSDAISDAKPGDTIVLYGDATASEDSYNIGNTITLVIDTAGVLRGSITNNGLIVNRGTLAATVSGSGKVYNDGGTITSSVDGVYQKVTFNIPDGATLTVADSNNQTVNANTPGIYYLTNGTYTYTVSKSGFKTVTFSFKVSGKNETFTVTLEEEEKPDPDPVYYTVTFNVYPYWATVTVKDAYAATDADVTVINNKVTVEEGKTYNYLVSAPGFYGTSGSFVASKNETITVELKLKTDLLVWPYSHGSVWTEEFDNGWVAVYTEPDSGYYLDDLTIYRVGYGAIDYGKWDNGVYYFRMRAGEQYIIDADFASAPSEYRVYVDSSILHGDVSVDTVYAEEGEWVYITVDPDVGYRLYNLTVTRPSGNTVKVEHVRDNVYRFSMPGVRVTVDAEFIRTVTPFTDVRLADWFYEYVSFAYRYGLMEGINSYQFAPDATATRAMVVQILYRMSGEPAVSYGSGFTDVASNAWYADAIAWAARNNIVNGTGAATFDPNAPVTREQFATMLYRYARYRGFNTSLTANILSYYDVNQVSEYAFEALQWACAEGIVNGTSTGYLTPQGNATRAQLAAMLMRFCNEYFDL